MSSIQVLVTTMHQVDDRKYQEMNLRTEAVIANQTNVEFEQHIQHGDNCVCFVSTKTRGLSKNRNIAISHINPSAEYIVFSDDDMVFVDDYEEIITTAFFEHPEVSAMKFNLNCISDRKISMKRFSSFHIANRREMGSWGVCGLVVKRELLHNCDLQFNERFGSGTENYCGEDTIFLQQLHKKRVVVGCSPMVIANIDQQESSWFVGYDSRYYTTAGMILQEIYPILCYLLALRSTWRAWIRGKTELKWHEILACYYNGIFKNKKDAMQKCSRKGNIVRG